MGIRCKECGKEFKNKIQYRHLKEEHNMTVNDYELKHGQGSTVANFDISSIPDEEKIECKECGWLFRNVITHSHLKIHGMTIKQYKQKYGDDSVATDFYRNTRATKALGENNPNYGNTWSDEQKHHLSEIKKNGHQDGTYVVHNKGVPMSDDQKRLLSDIKKKGFADGTYTAPFKGRVHSEENKKILSCRQKEYARSNPAEMSQRAKKAYQTRLKNGSNVDLTKYPRSPESIERNRKQATEKARLKAAASVVKIESFMKAEGFDVHEIDDSSKGYVTFTCNCGSGIQHTTTRQMFHPSKYKSYNGICRFCDVGGKSLGEIEIGKWIESHGIEIQTNYRSAIYPHELDIFIPSHNLAIEFNGLYWHSELQGKDKHYHNHKRMLCESKNIRLIQIMEDEWNTKPDIVKSVIGNALGIVERRISARKTTARQIEVGVARDFVNRYHLAGYHNSRYKFGLFDGDELVSVMTFSTGNYSRKSKGWEIDRFCSKTGVQVVGGASKLFTAFIRLEKPTTVISYADLRHGSGLVYKHLGFEEHGDTSPNYWYFKTHLERFHRFNLRKGAVEGDDPSLTEWQNRVKQGWNRIWDCGSRKYVWTDITD